MKKKKYICPEVSVYALETQGSMLSLSLSDEGASSRYGVDVNERDDEFSDIWGNDY